MRNALKNVTAYFKTNLHLIFLDPSLTIYIQVVGLAVWRGDTDSSLFCPPWCPHQRECKT